MTDIVDRLKCIDFTFWYSPIGPDDTFEPIEIGKMAKEAADEIERLREEIDELKDLLQCTVNYTGASVSSSRFAFHAALKEGE